MEKWKISGKKLILKEPNGNYKTEKYNQKNSLDGLNNRMEDERVSEQTNRIELT